MNDYTKKLIAATANVDWAQLYMNGGGCFHVEDDGTLCGRARSWTGHGVAAHAFVALDEAIALVAGAAPVQLAAPNSCANCYRITRHRVEVPRGEPCPICRCREILT